MAVCCSCAAPSQALNCSRVDGSPRDMNAAVQFARAILLPPVDAVPNQGHTLARPSMKLGRMTTNQPMYLLLQTQAQAAEEA